MIAQKSEKPFSKIAVVGDRLYTDIALGKKHGILSVLVLSGETKIDDVTDENRADIIVDGIGDLIQYT
jgi:ribonucleotide monophosphatase NagD (HAD superfamily)